MLYVFRFSALRLSIAAFVAATAEVLGLLRHGLHLRLQVLLLQRHHLLDVLGAHQLLGEFERIGDVLLGEAIAFWPTSLALDCAVAACVSAVATAFWAAATKPSTALRACSTLCSANWRIWVGTSKFHFGSLAISFLLAVLRTAIIAGIAGFATHCRVTTRNRR